MCQPPVLFESFWIFQSFLFAFSSKKIVCIGSMCSILALLKLLLLLRIIFISDIKYVESVTILAYYFAIL